MDEEETKHSEEATTTFVVRNEIFGASDSDDLCDEIEAKKVQTIIFENCTFTCIYPLLNAILHNKFVEVVSISHCKQRFGPEDEDRAVPGDYLNSKITYLNINDTNLDRHCTAVLHYWITSGDNEKRMKSLRMVRVVKELGHLHLVLRNFFHLEALVISGNKAQEGLCMNGLCGTLSRNKKLQVLDVSNCGLGMFPDVMTELIHPLVKQLQELVCLSIDQNGLLSQDFSVLRKAVYDHPHLLVIMAENPIL